MFTPALKAHPGPGIVKDSKGNICYTDLVNVWKISPNGHKAIAVSAVHTHQLYIDQKDVLFGEHLWYNGEQSDNWNCYAWKLYPNGKLDTIFGPAAAFQNEYTLNRDARGNQYYIQNHPVKKFFRINLDGSVMKLAEGNYHITGYMLITPEGNWYFTSQNILYLLDTSGRISRVANDIGSYSSSHPGNFNLPNTLGMWNGRQQNIYVADYSGQKVKRVNPQGKVEVIAYSKSPWSPVGGLIDDQKNLWLLENDVSNQVRVRKILQANFRSEHEFELPIWKHGLPLAIFMAILLGACYFFISSKILLWAMSSKLHLTMFAAHYSKHITRRLTFSWPASFSGIFYPGNSSIYSSWPASFLFKRPASFFRR